MLHGYDSTEAICGELAEENRKLKALGNKYSLREKVIEVLENLEYYDVVNEQCESLEAELIADVVLETIADYLKGGAE